MKWRIKAKKWGRKKGKKGIPFQGNKNRAPNSLPARTPKELGPTLNGGGKNLKKWGIKNNGNPKR